MALSLFHLRMTGVIAVLLVVPPLKAQERPIAFTGAEILPISSAAIDDGVLIVEGGVITAVGPRAAVTIPADAIVYEATGQVIMPGLVDTHSHIGGGDGGGGASPIHGDVRILDALDVRHDRIRTARAGGLTTVNIMPGSGLLMSGQTAYVKLKNGRTIGDLLFCEDVLADVCGGLKMANGTNPLAEGSESPSTRAKSAALVRQRFLDAQNYQQRLRAAGDDPSQRPDRDLELELLVEVLEQKRIVHHHTHRHDDILTVLRLQREFDFPLVLHHVTEGGMVAEEIATAGVPASIILIDAPGGKLEAMNLSFGTGAALESAGVSVAYHTDDPITDSRHLLRSAAIGVRAGMSREGALQALTLAGATMLGLEDRVGSLEVAKDADFIILSGDPFSIYSHVEQTWIDGTKVFDREHPDDLKYAVGGYKVTEAPTYSEEEVQP